MRKTVSSVKNTVKAFLSKQNKIYDIWSKNPQNPFYLQQKQAMPSSDPREVARNLKIDMEGLWGI